MLYMQTNIHLIKIGFTYSGIKGTRTVATAAKPNCEQKTARYAQRESVCPVELITMKATSGPMPYEIPTQQVKIPRNAKGDI